MSLKNLYYFFEDRYYGVLDKINKKIPVYKVIDPIDKVFPSFVLFSGIFFALIFLLIFMFLWSPALTSSVFVSDEDGNPIGGVTVTASFAETEVSDLTDGDGLVFLPIPSAEVTALLIVDKDGFIRFEEERTLSSSDLLEIALSSVGNAVASLQGETTEWSLIVANSDTGNMISETEVTVSFNCQKSDASDPISQTKKPARFAIQVPSNCGILTVNASASGYNSKSAYVTSSGQKIFLSPEGVQESTGSLRVTVVDASGDGVEEVRVTVMDSGTDVEVARSFTDSLGRELFSQLEPGQYDVIAVDEENNNRSASAEVQVNAAQETAIELELPRASAPEDSFKLFLKTVDAETDEAIGNIGLRIYKNGLLFEETISDLETGELTVVVNASDSNAEFHAVASDLTGSYLSRVFSVTLKEPDDSEPELLELTPFDGECDSECGSLQVTVLHESGVPAENASVFVYDSDFPSIPLMFAFDGTDSVGQTSFTALRADQYIVKAETSDEFGESDPVTVSNGATAEVEIRMSLKAGVINVIVQNSEGGFIEGAAVEFVNAVSEAYGEIIDVCESNEYGECRSEPISAGELVFVKVSADGYFPAIIGDRFGESIEIQAENSYVIRIVLDSEDLYTIADSDWVEWGGLFARQADGFAPVSRIEENASYYALFNLFVSDEGYDTLKQFITVDQDLEQTIGERTLHLLPEPSVIEIDSSNAVVAPALSFFYESLCFDPVNEFLVPREEVCFGSGKLLIAEWGALGRVRIPVYVKVSIQPDSLGEFAYIKSKAKVNDMVSDLLEKRFVVGAEECPEGINQVIWEVQSVLDPDGTEIEPEFFGSSTIYDIYVDQPYTLNYSVHNCTERNLTDAEHLISTGEEGNPLNLSADPLVASINLPQGFRLVQSLSFTPATSAVVDLRLNVSKGSFSSTKTVTFDIDGTIQMRFDESLPIYLIPGMSHTISGRVLHVSGSVPVPNATIQALNRSGTNIGVQNSVTTNADGEFSITVNLERHSDVANVFLHAEKTNYAPIEEAIPVQYPSDFLPLDCVQVNTDEILPLTLPDPNFNTFEIQNNCGETLLVTADFQEDDISLGTREYADLSEEELEEYAEQHMSLFVSLLTDAELAALEGTSSLPGRGFLIIPDGEVFVADLQAEPNARQGIHPIVLTARSNSMQPTFVGIVEASIENTASCFSIDSPLPPAFDFLDPEVIKQPGTILNRCATNEYYSSYLPSLALYSEIADLEYEPVSLAECGGTFDWTMYWAADAFALCTGNTTLGETDISGTQITEREGVFFLANETPIYPLGKTLTFLRTTINARLSEVEGACPDLPEFRNPRDWVDEHLFVSGTTTFYNNTFVNFYLEDEGIDWFTEELNLYNSALLFYGGAFTTYNPTIAGLAHSVYMAVENELASDEFISKDQANEFLELASDEFSEAFSAGMETSNCVLSEFKKESLSLFRLNLIGYFSNNLLRSDERTNPVTITSKINDLEQAIVEISSYSEAVSLLEADFDNALEADGLTLSTENFKPALVSEAQVNNFVWPKFKMVDGTPTVNVSAEIREFIEELETSVSGSAGSLMVLTHESYNDSRSSLLDIIDGAVSLESRDSSSDRCAIAFLRYKLVDKVREKFNASKIKREKTNKQLFIDLVEAYSQGSFSVDPEMIYPTLSSFLDSFSDSQKALFSEAIGFGGLHFGHTTNLSEEELLERIISDMTEDDAGNIIKTFKDHPFPYIGLRQLRTLLYPNVFSEYREDPQRWEIDSWRACAEEGDTCDGMGLTEYFLELFDGFLNELLNGSEITIDSGFVDISGFVNSVLEKFDERFGETIATPNYFDNLELSFDVSNDDIMLWIEGTKIKSKYVGEFTQAVLEEYCTEESADAVELVLETDVGLGDPETWIDLGIGYFGSMGGSDDYELSPEELERMHVTDTIPGGMGPTPPTPDPAGSSDPIPHPSDSMSEGIGPMAESADEPSPTGWRTEQVPGGWSVLGSPTGHGGLPGADGLIIPTGWFEFFGLVNAPKPIDFNVVEIEISGNNYEILYAQDVVEGN